MICLRRRRHKYELLIKKCVSSHQKSAIKYVYGAIKENLTADIFGKMGRKLYYFHNIPMYMTFHAHRSISVSERIVKIPTHAKHQPSKTMDSRPSFCLKNKA